MIRNYFKIAWRTMMRNKGYSFINIVGLTLGITCASLLVLYINDELSFDKFHSKSDRTYRIVEIDESQQATRQYGITSAPVGPAMVDEFPQVVNFSRILQLKGHVDFVMNDMRYGERKWGMVDSTFLDVFDFKLIKGDRSSALKEMKSIILTESAARKYFGDDDPINQTMTEVSFGDYTVTGVIEDFPTNSHLDLDVIMSHFSSDEQFMSIANAWDEYRAFTYVVLDDKINFKAVSENIPEFIGRHWEPEENRNFFLQPIEQIYFGSENIEFGAESRSGQLYYIYIFSGVAIFILLIAGINYMNLATAKSGSRAMEIGLRKSSGAQRWQLVTQFLSESMSITVMAFLLSIGLLDILLPYFNDLTGKGFELSFETFGSILGIQLAISLLIGLVSGSYPAMVLSGFKPATVLKGESVMISNNPWLRKILVIGQFSLSIIMIVAMIVIGNQLDYISSKNSGFEKDKIVVVDINNGEVRRNFETMKTEFLKVEGVKKVGASSRVPGEWKGFRQVDTKAQELSSDTLEVYFMGFDEDVIDTYEMDLLSGINFEGIEANDSTRILLNETAVKAYGLEDPIGMKISVIGMEYPMTVIGVVKDFHFQSLYETVKPLMIGYWYHPLQAIDYFSIKIDGVNMERTIAGLTKVHETFDEATPIEYHFLDSQIELFYQNDRVAGKIFFIGSFLTITISCMGLFGLASFTMQRRMKEISLRKVLGASTQNLFLLLIKSFSIQILISLVVASPIAYFLMDNWLESFAYRQGINMAPFLTAGAVALLIAIVTVSYSCLKAVTSNPAETLKHQ